MMRLFTGFNAEFLDELLRDLVSCTKKLMVGMRTRCHQLISEVEHFDVNEGDWKRPMVTWMGV